MVFPLQPLQHATDTALSEGDRSVRGAIVQVERVAILPDRVAAGEDDVVHVTRALVVRFRRQHELVAWPQTARGVV